MACRELTIWRNWYGLVTVAPAGDEDTQTLVDEILAKAAGEPGEGTV
jgi:hypothetical protein